MLTSLLLTYGGLYQTTSSFGIVEFHSTCQLSTYLAVVPKTLSKRNTWNLMSITDLNRKKKSILRYSAFWWGSDIGVAECEMSLFSQTGWWIEGNLTQCLKEGFKIAKDVGGSWEVGHFCGRKQKFWTEIVSKFSWEYTPEIWSNEIGQEQLVRQPAHIITQQYSFENDETDRLWKQLALI